MNQNFDKELTLENIEKVIDRKLEEKLETKLEEKLEEKLEKKLDEKLDEKLSKRLAPIELMINKLWAKQVEMTAKLDIAIDSIISHNDRISNAETRMTRNEENMDLMDIRIRLLEARKLGHE